MPVLKTNSNNFNLPCEITQFWSITKDSKSVYLFELFVSGATTDTTTLFRYFGGESWETYNHPEFVPEFNIAVPNDETKALCGGLFTKNHNC